MKSSPTGLRLRARIRVLCGDEIALGPGKIDLLRVVGQTGSIRVAAEQMGMSYMRAWSLIRTMNACFKEPLVQAVRGGPSHGGARLTPTGQLALDLYEQMEKDFMRANAVTWRRLKTVLRG
jgi:molybdate transport system regulatory protein